MCITLQDSSLVAFKITADRASNFSNLSYSAHHLGHLHQRWWAWIPQASEEWPDQPGKLQSLKKTAHELFTSSMCLITQTRWFHHDLVTSKPISIGLSWFEAACSEYLHIKLQSDILLWLFWNFIKIKSEMQGAMNSHQHRGEILSGHPNIKVGPPWHSSTGEAQENVQIVVFKVFWAGWEPLWWQSAGSINPLATVKLLVMQRNMHYTVSVLSDTHLDQSQCMLCMQLVSATQVVNIKSWFPLGMH